MSDHRFADFLAQSFGALQRELPAVYAQLCRQLCPREVGIVVDGETVAACFQRDDVRLSRHRVNPAVEMRTSRGAILAVIDGESTLLDSILDDRLCLRGGPEDVLAFHEALLTYVHGAVRAPSFPGLLADFRTASPEAADRPVAAPQTTNAFRMAGRV